MHWDPQQYGRFAAERGRPFLDLIARIGTRGAAPRRRSRLRARAR